MKKLFAILAIVSGLVSMNAQAETTKLRLQVQGTASFEMSYTITCMAIGCPPSLPYYYVNLRDVNGVEVNYSAAILALQEVATKPGVSEKPAAIVFNGLSIREGDLLTVDLELEQLSLSGISFVSRVYDITRAVTIQ